MRASRRWWRTQLKGRIDMAKKTKKDVDPNLTLAQLSERYLDHMEREGKSLGTCFSYGMELKAAQAELGAETLVAAISAEDVERFNKSKRVTKLNSGKPKAQPSIDKTRRVLRLAITWAVQVGLVAASPYSSKDEAPADEPTPPKPKKARKARRVELAISQVDAEAAADVAEAALNGTPAA
jgi:hypothetical protein